MRRNLAGVHPVLPRAVLIALGLLALLEGLVRLLPEHLSANPVAMEPRMHLVEALATPAETRPEVVILGSSRPALGIAPAVVEATAGLPEGAVSNLAVPGAAPYTSGRMFARHRESILAARLVVYCVDEFFLTGLESEFLEAEPLAVHLANIAPEERPNAVLDRALTYRVRLPWILRRLEAGLGIVPKLPSLGWTRGNDRLLRMSEIEGSRATPAQMDRVVAEYYRESRQVPRSAEFMTEAAVAIRRTGVDFVFLEMPYHPYHFQAVRTRFAPSRQAFSAAMQALAGRAGVPFLNWSDGRMCRLSENDFADGVHLTRLGAKRFSRCLGRWIRDRRTEAAPAALPSR